MIGDMVALIPARAGSQRIPGKNMKRLGGHPLIAYTIAVAQDSGLFSRIIVCTDDKDVACYATDAGVAVRWREPVSSDQPDIVWVKEALSDGPPPWHFCILRPTSPFRSVKMLHRAKKRFDADCLNADSLRAVEPVTQHPGKMWTWLGQGYQILPLLDRYLTLYTLNTPDSNINPIKHEGPRVPWHSSPTQSLPVHYVQNASLEMGWTRNVEVHGTIHGRSVMPFFTAGYEGFDLNEPRDWREAEYLIAAGAAVLPEIPVARV